MFTKVFPVPLSLIIPYLPFPNSPHVYPPIMKKITELNDEQIERYSRHIILKEVGYAGQLKILNSSVLIIGAGGLGAPIGLYLAAAGVGKIGIIDGDRVDITNLQRQVIHHTKDIGIAKVESAAEKMRAINPDIEIITYQDLFMAHNAFDLMKGYDFVIDGTDNFPAKFLVNDACVLAGMPFSHGGILRFVGQTMTVLPGQSACYRCVFFQPPPANAIPSCSQAGVLGVLAGVLGTLQATEALKFFLKQGDLLINTMLTYDALKMNFRKISFKKNPNCPICGDNPKIKELLDERQIVCDLKK